MYEECLEMMNGYGMGFGGLVILTGYLILIGIVLLVVLVILTSQTQRGRIK